ncbi:peptidoglycan-binding protein LysM, partial [Pseudomonas sp. SAICEU22]|nr:peptidoglycan-binding protein LysM [Pseudomonas agronomica]
PVAAPSDEFELNLDGLSLENSWDLADNPSAAPEPSTPAARADTLALSGFDEPDLQWGAPLETESLDDDFLDGFANEEQALELEP